MPQALVPVFAAIGFSATAAAVAAAITATILINVALGQISRLLTKRPRLLAPPINVTIRSTTEYRRIVLGTTRAAGAFTYYNVSGTSNKFLWYVIVYAGHQSADIRDAWLDTQKVTDAQINGGDPAGGAVTTGAFANKLWIYKYLGTSTQTVDINIDAAFSEWTGNHRLRGCTYIVVKMERDDQKFPQGAPQNITVLMDGALLYDPRKDSTNGGIGAHRRTDPRTWEFGTIGRIPALHWRWFVSGGSVHNDVSTRLIMYGLRESDTRIDDTYVIAAANECDETLSGGNAPPSGSQARYRCDLEVSCGETRRDIIEHILQTMAGSHVMVHGKHRVYAGAYDAPAHTFTQADLYGQLEVEDTVDHARRYNAVAGVFRDAGKAYVEATTIFRTDAAYETQDGGKRIQLELDLRGVSDPYQAQRLCEIKLRKSRMMRAVKLVGALNLLKVALNETLNYSHTRYTWTSRVFRCAERQFEFNEEAGRVSLTCQREDSSVWADMLTADYTTGTSATDVFSTDIPDAPTNLRTTGRLNGILIEWDAPALVYPGTIFEARESTASSMTSPTTVYQGKDTQKLIAKTTTSNFYYQVRAVRNAQPSAWLPATSGILGKASSVSAVLSATASPGSVSSTSGATSQTTPSTTVTPSGGTSPYTYAWTWASGGTSITINLSTAATTSFTASSLTSGETRSGQARCTVTDNVSATTAVDVSVSITRPAPTITAPPINLFALKISPDDASVAFRVDNDGHWYTGTTTGLPTTDRGLWCDPPEYAGDYQIRVTRTGGNQTVFTSGPLLGTYHPLTADQEWRLTETASTGLKNIIFTIDTRRTADSVVMGTTTNNECKAETEI